MIVSPPSAPTLRLGSLVAVGCLVVLPWGAIASHPAMTPEGGPELVGPATISTDAVEHGATLTPDGGTVYFSRSDGAWGESGRTRIMVSHRSGDGWSAPVTAAFSGTWDDSDPFVSPAGDKLYFVSDRPVDGVQGTPDLWRVHLAGPATGQVEHLGPEVNSEGVEYSPVVTREGVLYFASTRPGGRGQGDLYRAEPKDGGFGTPTPLGPEINSPLGEWNLWVDADDQVLIFEASGRALNRSGSGDLYASFRDGDSWSHAVPLASINTTGSDLLPRPTPDGRDLLFATSYSLDGDHTDIVRVPLAPLLEEARQAQPALLVAASRSGHHVAVVDPGSLAIHARLPTGPGPHEVAVAGRTVLAPAYGIFPTPHDGVAHTHPGWVEGEHGNRVHAQSTGGADAMETALTDCARSHGVVASQDGTRVWVTCEEEREVLELDAANLEVLRRWPTHAAGSHRIAATHGDRYLTVANVDDGSVTVIDRENGQWTTLDTGAGSEGLAVAPDGGLWVAASGDDRLTLVDPRVPEIVRSVASGGRFPISVAVDAQTGHAWVANMGPRAVDVVNLDDGSQVDRVVFETAPLRVLVPTGSRHAYVSLPRENRVAVLDRRSRRVVGSIDGIMEVDGLDWIEPTPRLVDQEVRVPPAGDVQTLAGPIEAGSGGLEVDADGNVYTADFGSMLNGQGEGGHRVYRITPSGEVRLFATGFRGASGNTMDAQGRLIQSNIGTSTISRVEVDGTLTELVSGGITNPVGIAYRDGDLMVANCGANTIGRVTPDGQVSTFATSDLLRCPNGLVTDPEGNLYASNFANGDIVRITPEGEASVLATVPGNNNGHLVFHEGGFYVAARGAHQIVRVEMDGSVRVVAGSGGRGVDDGPLLEATLNYPNDLAVSPDGRILYWNDVGAVVQDGGVTLAPTYIRMIRIP